MITPSLAQVQNATTWADVGLVVPELILIGAALGLLLAARWIARTQVAVVVTVIAALVAGWMSAASGEVGFGGMFVVDGYSHFFKVLMIAALALAAMLSVKSVDSERIPRAEYHALLLLATTGMMLAASALDLLTLYLALELVTLCSYILVGITVERPGSNEAAIKYLLLGSFASALLLFGISLTFGITGATDFAGIAQALSAANPGENPLLIVAIGLVIAGLAFKIAAVPFHAWAPDAYEGAIAPVAGFLAAGSKAAGLAALGRVVLIAFESEARILSVFLVALAGLSILVGSVLAIPQSNMRRLLAYSSIAHAGYALLGISAATPEGASATMTYTFFYVFMTLGTFGVVIALGERGETVSGFQGLAKERPRTAALMLLFLLALTGIPPTAGFAAKFVVILSAVRAGHIVLAVLAVLCSVVTAFVYMRVAVLMYMKEPEHPAEPAPSRFPMAISAAIAIAALVTLFGGIDPSRFALWGVAP